MLTVLSDTHGTDAADLRGRTREAVLSAEMVAHAGDFATSAVLADFERDADSFRAVHGNNDDGDVRDRLPAVRTFEYGGVRLAMTHGHGRRRGSTALSMLGRERDADAVVFGHSHRPEFDDSEALPLLNPGSHAQPRGHRPAHAELEPREGDVAGLAGRLCTPDGDVFERFEIAPADR